MKNLIFGFIATFLTTLCINAQNTYDNFSTDINVFIDKTIKSETLKEINFVDNLNKYGHYLSLEQLNRLKSELGLTDPKYNSITLEFIDKQIKLSIENFKQKSLKTILLNSGFTSNNVDLAIEIINNPKLDIRNLTNYSNLTKDEIDQLEITQQIVNNQFTSQLNTSRCGVSDGTNYAPVNCTTIGFLGGAIAGGYAGSLLCGLPCGIGGALVGGAIGAIVGFIFEEK